MRRSTRFHAELRVFKTGMFHNLTTGERTSRNMERHKLKAATAETKIKQDQQDWISEPNSFLRGGWQHTLDSKTARAAGQSHPIVFAFEPELWPTRNGSSKRMLSWSTAWPVFTAVWCSSMPVQASVTGDWLPISTLVTTTIYNAAGPLRGP